MYISGQRRVELALEKLVQRESGITEEDREDPEEVDMMVKRIWIMEFKEMK